jgi:hypothetical protein
MKKASKAPHQARALEMDPTRRATRVPTSIDIKWGFGEVCEYDGTIINLTVLGCAVHNKEGVEVQPGQVVFIRFWMPAERILKIEVVHTALGGVEGFGARFLDLADEDKATLEEMVQLFGEPHQSKQPSKRK